MKTTGWKEIPFAEMTTESYEKLRQHLTWKNPQHTKLERLGYPTGNAPQLIQAWERGEGVFLVPRNFGNSRFEKEPEYQSVPVKWPKTTWTPRPHQIMPLKVLEEKKEGTIILPCGSGKSILTLLYLAKRGQRALVLVPTKTLVGQWVEYFNNVFNGKGGAKKITSKNWEAAEHLSVTTYQQIALHPLPEGFYEQFGVTVYDEIDVANAVQLSKAFPALNTERVGLTATKHREDKMDILGDLHIGPPIYENTQMPDSVKPNLWVKATGIFLNPSAPIAREITAASMHPAKQKLVFEYIRKATAKDRKVFVLCERIDQAEWYHRLAQEMKLESSLAHSKVKEKDRDFSKQIIFATNLLGRGFNRVDLDTLIVTGVYSYSGREFRQLLGRVQRVVEGKKHVIVIVLQDRHSMLAAKLRRIIDSTRDLIKEVFAL